MCKYKNICPNYSKDDINCCFRILYLECKDYKIYIKFKIITHLNGVNHEY